jgi:hypothetical protein
MSKIKMTKVMLVTAAMISMISCGLCEEKSLYEQKSPGGSYIAAVYRRNCGSTSRLLYHVNVRKRWSWFSSDSRGVIEDGQVFLTGKGKIEVAWKDEKTLVVSCHNCDEDKKPIMENSWGEVNILYELR